VFDLQSTDLSSPQDIVTAADVKLLKRSNKNAYDRPPSKRVDSCPKNTECFANHRLAQTLESVCCKVARASMKYDTSPFLGTARLLSVVDARRQIPATVTDFYRDALNETATRGVSPK
jgi:hypothetical protein